MDKLDANYWEARWQAGKTGWDIGSPSPALLTYLQSWPKDTRILIPGAGQAHEARWLYQHGYTEVYVCDWSETALERLQQSEVDFPADQLLLGDFFHLDIEVELIIEQTFFCAISPALRAAYARKAYEILAPAGTLAGLFWACHFAQDGPPFGGDLAEYRTYFDPYFDLLQSDITSLSIKPRQGREYFLEMRKR